MTDEEFDQLGRDMDFAAYLWIRRAILVVGVIVLIVKILTGWP